MIENKGYNMLITSEQLKKIASIKQDKIDLFLEPLNKAMAQYEINTKNRIAAFIAQVLVESSNFETMQENLYYTTASRLQVVWPRAFPDLKIAQQYLRNPEKLANRVYSGTYNKFLGNGDESTGDGWKFSGKGLIQLTGKYNFVQASKEMNIDFVGNPNLLLDPQYACLTAAHFFKSKGCNKLADMRLFEQVTGRINAAKLHLEERTKLYKKGLEVL